MQKIIVLLVIVVFLALAPLPFASPSASSTSGHLDAVKARIRTQFGDSSDGRKASEARLSSGLKAWALGPARDSARASDLSEGLAGFGTNVNANNPRRDYARGQSETAIAVGKTASQTRVLAAWNDASGFLFVDSRGRRASLTGVGYSHDGGRTFRDLIGLPNSNPDQQWFGDPSVVAVDNGRYFIVASLYLPSLTACSGAGDFTEFSIAVSVGWVSDDGKLITFRMPVVAVHGGDDRDKANLCRDWDDLDPSLAFPDKLFLSFDQTARTLVVSYTRFYLLYPHTGLGQIEVIRAKVPGDPTNLGESDFSRPVVVWPEEPCPDPWFTFDCGAVNQGAYPVISPNGDVYAAWERNIDTNLWFGDPCVYIHIAWVPRSWGRPKVGGPDHPLLVSSGQRNPCNNAGGVRSLDAVAIAGYNRGLGNDFPRIAYYRSRQQVLVAWNDASLSPLGDIFLRGMSRDLTVFSPIVRVNDRVDNTLHFLPAISVGSDGGIRTSWYCRSRPDSTMTGYCGEARPNVLTNGADSQITTGPSDWNATSTLIAPNFGDYTDSSTVGRTTCFTWSDGRIGVPQPFVDCRDF